MRLINVHDLTLKEFTTRIPEYMVLSHCWTDDELSFKDLSKRRYGFQNLGYNKILRFCEYVKNGIPAGTTMDWNKAVDYVWVDTCCIDKRSSAELSEAINSMWKIYAGSLACVVYLGDVQLEEDSHEQLPSTLKMSRWFTRGWTLQELLAPSEVVFCDNHWQTIGTLHENFKLQETVAEATRIEKEYFAGASKNARLSRACVAKKLSWASSRQTSRPEDVAYCLLGLLSINMPLLYGEGAQRAFLRLQQEVIRQSDDESLFAWTTKYSSKSLHGILATEIRVFHDAGNVECIPPGDAEYTHRPPYTLTNKGLQFESVASVVQTDMQLRHLAKQYWWISLNCRKRDLPQHGQLEFGGRDGVPSRKKRKKDGHEEKSETRRCMIVLQQLRGGVSYRYSADTLSPELEQGQSICETGSEQFLIKLIGGMVGNDTSANPLGTTYV